MANESGQRFSDKLFKLKLKCVLVPLLAVMIGVWIDGLFTVFGLEALTFVYFNSFMLLRSVQFHMMADSIRIQLELINEDLVNLLEIEKVSIDLQYVRVKMEKIRTDYIRLKDISIAVNECTAWSALSLILLYASFLICVTYWFLLSLFKDILMLEAYQSICYILVLFLVLAISSDPCTQCIGLVTFSLRVWNDLFTFISIFLLLEHSTWLQHSQDTTTGNGPRNGNSISYSNRKQPHLIYGSRLLSSQLRSFSVGMLNVITVINLKTLQKINFLDSCCYSHVPHDSHIVW